MSDSPTPSQRITEEATAWPIESETDVPAVIAPLRLNFDRVVARHGLPVEA